MRVVWLLCAVILIIMLDTLLGIIRAVTQGEFDPRKLPQFLRTNILPFVGALLLMGLFSMVKLDPQYDPQGLLVFIEVLYFACVAATAWKFGADIKTKLVEVFGPLQE